MADLGTEQPDRRAAHLGSRVWFELALFTGSEAEEGSSFSESASSTTFIGVSPALRARFAQKHFRIDADLPFAASVIVPSQGNASGAARAGNPNASGSGVFRLGESGWMSAGVGIALPIASLPEEAPSSDVVAAATAYNLAIDMHNWEVWRFLVKRLSVFTPIELEVGSRRVRFGVEGALVRSFWTGEGSHDDLTMLQLGGRVQSVASSTFSFGARVRHTLVVDSDLDDPFQSSIEPFFELTPGHFLFGMGMLFNVDEPNGVGADLFVWGPQFSIGGQF